MNCQEFRNSLPLRGNDVSEEHASHLTLCAACAAYWEPHRSLSAGLQSLAEELRSEQAPARVEAGLRAAFRMQNARTPRRMQEPVWWTPVLTWAAAAAAMIALAFVLLHGWHTGPAVPDTVAAPSVNPRPAPEVAYYQTDESTDSGVDDPSLQLGEGFVSLPNAPRIEPNEDINVVRFEVPGSTMIAWGLALSEDRASETVVADVALGPEGMARAVRLVTDNGILEE